MFLCICEWPWAPAAGHKAKIAGNIACVFRWKRNHVRHWHSVLLTSSFRQCLQEVNFFFHRTLFHQAFLLWRYLIPLFSLGFVGRRPCHKPLVSIRWRVALEYFCKKKICLPKNKLQAWFPKCLSDNTPVWKVVGIRVVPCSSPTKVLQVKFANNLCFLSKVFT